MCSRGGCCVKSFLLHFRAFQTVVRYGLLGGSPMPSVACGTRRGAAACGLPGKPPCTVTPCRTAGMFCLHLLHGNAVRAVLRADTCRFALSNGTYRHTAEAVSRDCFCSSANGWLPGCWLAAYSARNMFTHSAPPLPCRGACCRTAVTAIKPLAAGLPGPGIRPCAWLLLRPVCCTMLR